MQRLSIASAACAGAVAGWSRPRRPASRSGSSTRSTARASSRRPASSTSTTTASSTSSRGDTWYQAPDWKPHHVRDVERQGTYYNDFATLPLDVNGDGNTDFVTVSYFGKNVGWVENPGKAGRRLDLPRDRRARHQRGGRGRRPDRRRHPRHPAEPDQHRRLVRGRQEGRRQGLRPQEARLRHAGRRPRRRLGRRQRRRPGRPAHPQGLVRGPRRPVARDLDLAPRLEPRRRPASRSSPATSTATACPTSSTAWATTTACSG